MAVSEESTEPTVTAAEAPAPQPLLVCLGSGYTDALPDQLGPLLHTLDAALQTVSSLVSHVTIAYPASHDGATPQDAAADQHDGYTLHPYVQAENSRLTVHTASTWLRVYEQMRALGTDAGLLLGAEAHTLSPEMLGSLIQVTLLRKADLALPRYALPQNQGLLNQAMLAPLSRALFGGKVRFPLPLDAGFSLRMAERMASAAQRVPAAAQAGTILWPVNEAAIAGFDLAEVGSSTREIPPTDGDISQILRDITGSLFSDIESKATFWQRTRTPRETLRVDTVVPPGVADAEPADDAEIDDLISSFRIGYTNLHDIWSLVLPPQTLVSLKRLSQASLEGFTISDALWVRIVYDFVLAHRLRTISRGHLLGALTPLYLAWVASHLLALRKGEASRPGQLGRAFEADRPYLVSRWRWPDRFNP